MKILIAGGGIGGLATALSLNALGSGRQPFGQGRPAQSPEHHQLRLDPWAFPAQHQLFPIQDFYLVQAVRREDGNYVTSAHVGANAPEPARTKMGLTRPLDLEWRTEPRKFCREAE